MIQRCSSQHTRCTETDLLGYEGSDVCYEGVVSAAWSVLVQIRSSSIDFELLAGANAIRLPIASSTLIHVLLPTDFICLAHRLQAYRLKHGLTLSLNVLTAAIIQGRISERSNLDISRLRAHQCPELPSDHFECYLDCSRRSSYFSA